MELSAERTDDGRIACRARCPECGAVAAALLQPRPQGVSRAEASFVAEQLELQLQAASCRHVRPEHDREALYERIKDAMNGRRPAP